MNRIYSVVWSRSLNQLVVASELAAPRGTVSRSCQKTSCAPGTLCAGIMTALLAMGGLGWAGGAQAQVSCATAPYNYYNGSTMCAGLLSQATTGGGTAIGYNAQSTAL